MSKIFFTDLIPVDADRFHGIQVDLVRRLYEVCNGIRQISNHRAADRGSDYGHLQGPRTAEEVVVAIKHELDANSLDRFFLVRVGCLFRRRSV